MSSPPRALLLVAIMASALLVSVTPGHADGSTATGTDAPPANDDFADATVLTGDFSEHIPNIDEATQEANEPDPGCISPPDYSVWYTFTLTADSGFEAYVDLPGYDDNAIVALYRGTDINNLEALHCDWSSYGYAWLRDIHLPGGHTYYIQASPRFEQHADDGMDVDFSFHDVEPNNHFADATVITTDTFQDTPIHEYANDEVGEDTDCGTRSLWYQYTPSQDGALALGYRYNYWMGVYTGSSVDALTEIGCSKNDGLSNELVVDVQAGTLYHIRLGHSHGAMPAGTFDFTFVGQLVNDDFADAQVVPALPFAMEELLAPASVEAAETSSCGDPAIDSIWYTFTAPITGTFVAMLEDQDPAFPVLTLYQGTDVASLTEIGCRDTHWRDLDLAVGVLAGETYHLRVALEEEDLDTVRMSMDVNVPPPNDDLADAIELVGDHVVVHADNRGATQEDDEPSVCSEAARSSIWYTYTPAAAGTLRVTSHDSDHATHMDVFTGTGFGDLDRVSGGCEAFQFAADLGTEYIIRVTGDFERGDVTLELDIGTAPANDDVADATPITLPFAETIDTSTALTEADDPASSCLANSRWYDVGTAPVTQWYRATVTNSDHEAHMGIYTVDAGLSSGYRFQDCLGSHSGDSSEILLEGGEEILLAIGGHDYQSGLADHTFEALPRPANDDFADRLTVTEGVPFPVEMRHATAEVDEPEGHCGWSGSFPRSLWYEWTPSVSGTALLDRAGDTSSFRIYQGTSVTDLEVVHCPSTYLDGNATFHVEAGETYLLHALALHWWDVPDLSHWSVDVVPGPPNDLIANAQPIGLGTTFVGPFDLATWEEGEAQCNFRDKTLWYSYEPAQDHWLRVDTLGRNQHDGLAVFAGDPGSLEELYCLGYGSEEHYWTDVVRAGTTYYFQAESHNDGLAGFNLVLTSLQRPVNDLLEDAQPLVSGTTWVQDTTGATQNAREPSPCGFPTSRTVWFSFEGGDGAAVIDTTGTDHDTLVAVYQVMPLGTWWGFNLESIARGGFLGWNELQLIGCFNIPAGGEVLAFPHLFYDQYYVQVAGYQRQVGELHLDFLSVDPGLVL
ncbi:MAG: hypothetical protein ACPGQL_04540 [Thermoplasmatota archaeon]